MSNELCKCGKVGKISCPNDERCTPAGTRLPNWQYKENFHAIGDTGDYVAHYEVTNGNISLCTNDDPEDITEKENTLQRVAKALNESGCKFYVNTKAKLALHIENMLLRNALEDMAESACDYEDENFKQVHSSECKACKAKVMLKSIKRKTNDTNGTHKG